LTGVSGSGKSTLLHDVLKKAFLKRRLSKEGTIDLKYAQVKGLDAFDDMVAIDQNPIGSTTRSDIATYIDVLTPLRHWFGALPEAVAKGLIPRYFSYYHRKGMCPHCFGFGYKTINLQFLPSVKMPCEQCHGKRLNPISLSIKYKGKSIADYLDQTIEENLNSFGHIAKVKRLLTVMLELGLGYLKLNQEMHTLSGGEAGRLRLLRDVAKKKKGKTLYLFDEPTIGLHFSDIEKLLKVFDSLKAKGHTLVIIEHNLDVIKHADYIVDLGPFAGPKGGQVLVEGPIEKVQKCATSQTAKFL
jgi:excinuclease ABC subunit A